MVSKDVKEIIYCYIIVKSIFKCSLQQSTDDFNDVNSPVSITLPKAQQDKLNHNINARS